MKKHMDCTNVYNDFKLCHCPGKRLIPLFVVERNQVSTCPMKFPWQKMPSQQQVLKSQGNMPQLVLQIYM